MIKNPKCIHCGCLETVKRGSRRGKLRYTCRSCGKSFQINRTRKLKNNILLLQHLDGTPFRKLANQYNFSHMTAYRKCMEALEDLPHCADVTRKYCSRYSGILLVDGKFVSVSGYDSKIPVIYGIDYLTHDIPTYILSLAENFLSLRKFFASLRLLKYPLRSVVSDDNLNISGACLEVYPNAAWQLCTNHFKENLRASLEVRTDSTYQPFMKRVEGMFRYKLSEDNFNKLGKDTWNIHKNDDLCIKVLLDIERRKPNLLAYLKVKDTPTTNNLIECFNSHLQGRLKTIKGFESFDHANLWINGYFLRRRLTKFTDCEGRFKHLNGKCSLEVSLKDDVGLPRLF